MVEALYYILNIVWLLKLHHNKDTRHVSPITDSQTVQAQTCTDTLEHETNSKFCLRNTALLEEHCTASGVLDCVMVSRKSCAYFLAKCFV